MGKQLTAGLAVWGISQLRISLGFLTGFVCWFPKIVVPQNGWFIIENS